MEGTNYVPDTQIEKLHLAAPQPPTPDELAIRQGIIAAEDEGREIDDATARRMAAQFHGGQDSALYSLASSGEIDKPRVEREIAQELECQTDPEVREWLNWLGAYCIRREHKGPVDGWHETTRDDPAPAQTIGAAAMHEVAPADDSAPETDDEPQPIEVWIGSLADYNEGYLHGAWVDATQDPDDLREAAQRILRTSRSAFAEEWAIFDYQGFGTLQLDEYEHLDTVSRIAKGIRQYGEAYAAWVAYVGTDNDEQLDRFEDHFLGEFDSVEAYVEHVIEETGIQRDLDEALLALPADLRQYVTIDTKAMARDWGFSLHVAETPAGGVWVFEP